MILLYDNLNVIIILLLLSKKAENQFLNRCKLLGHFCNETSFETKQNWPCKLHLPFGVHLEIVCRSRPCENEAAGMFESGYFVNSFMLTCSTGF